MVDQRALVSVVQGWFGVWALLLGAALSCACSPSAGAEGVAQGGSGSAPPLTGVTFHKDVEPILQRSCQSCHVSGGIAPFPLLTYADARPFAAAMVQKTKSREMPPWHAQNTDECTVPLGWKNDTRLSELEIATFDAWNAAGSPEGDANDAPPPRAQAPGLPGVQQELKPATPFALAPGGDQFRCFVLDPMLSKDSFVNGVFVVPGNAAVVHHVLVFTDPKRTSLAKADASHSYDCFGGAQVD
ncbi:MAG TPA: cytochrome c, partial [Polyangiaceae bacterium]